MRYSQQPPGIAAAAMRPPMTPWVKRLLIATGVVFAVSLFVGAAPLFDLFAFAPARIWERPWGMLTYMFVHAGFWHLLMNALFIFFFGPPLESRWGSAMFLRFYVICGLGGVLLSFAFSDANIVGASAACYGIMLAFAMIWPNAPVYVWGILPVKVKWLVIFLVAISFLSAIGPGGGGIAHLAHLGGAIAGFAMMKSGWLPNFAPGGPGLGGMGPGAGGARPQGGGSGTGAARWWRDVARRARSRARKRRRRAWVVRDGGATGARGDASGRSANERRAERKRAELDRVDAVLDKISAEGMGALTAEERDLLDRVSRQTRAN